MLTHGALGTAAHEHDDGIETDRVRIPPDPSKVKDAGLNTGSVHDQTA
jgi:hypothetical protein